MRLLLVEDNVALADELLAGLNRQGYAVDWLADGRDAARQGLTEPYDLVVLDLGLPGLPGLEVLGQWRAAGCHVPVLVLTARSAWAERIEGLKAGADDYLSKPFHPEELHLRVQSLLRRARGLANQPQLHGAGLQLDEGRQCVTQAGEEVQLTSAEFRLLRYFMLHPGQILSKGHLAEHLYDGETERDSNVLEVHVNHLRRKLGREVLETRRGQGYIFGGNPGQVSAVVPG
ncbi:response regulator transcription factor [Pseudomonas sp. HR96]|uniref:response regulator transcription factor n=1 Tax=Pseudomonas sp. HR96 TaxID=1027966 RepID=UPI002A755551|nr:response regulator transcription factor [Pseudomonas sp. HR96]WPP01786.1 response regulator transcription factor [Pseudomonas sp. HR96]